MTDYKKLLENSIRRLRQSELSGRNKEIILDFHDYCFSLGLSTRRVLKYLCCLPKLARWLDRDFDKATKRDIQRLMATIEKSDHACRTKYDLKKIVKRFYKWLEGEDEYYPRKVRWIKCTLKNAGKRLPEEMLTQKEVQGMIQAVHQMRDKALISALYEGGLRAGEVLALKIKHVQFHSNYLKLTIPQKGKTGVRNIVLVTSIPYLSNWISHHPRAGDPDAPLWVSIGTLNHGQAICYNTMRKILTQAAEKCGVKKRVNPHSFRHARATFLANILTESQLKKYFGWTQGSKMAAVYVHLSGRDVDNAILEIHGLKKKETDRADQELEPVQCPRCKTRNEPEVEICTNCGMPLTVKAAADAERKEEQFMRLMDPEVVEKMIEKKVQRLLKERADE